MPIEFRKPGERPLLRLSTDDEDADWLRSVKTDTSRDEEKGREAAVAHIRELVDKYEAEQDARRNA